MPCFLRWSRLCGARGAPPGETRSASVVCGVCLRFLLRNLPAVSTGQWDVETRGWDKAGWLCLDGAASEVGGSCTLRPGSVLALAALRSVQSVRAAGGQGLVVFAATAQLEAA